MTMLIQAMTACFYSLARPLQSAAGGPAGADEIARAVEREVARRARVSGAPAWVRVEVGGDGLSAIVTQRLESTAFAAELAERARVASGAGVAPTLAVRCVPGAAHGAPRVCFDGRPPARAELHWQPGGSYLVDGRRCSLLAGRGPFGVELPGAPNDIQLPAALTFIGGDAFRLRWEPAVEAWLLTPSERHRDRLRVRRGGVDCVLHAPLPLQGGDTILILGASRRFEITFHLLPETP
ncbi:MAG: hypothetical protein V4850_17635 [Myxococcota bacterium]